jgi:hypothetical protein
MRPGVGRRWRGDLFLLQSQKPAQDLDEDNVQEEATIRKLTPVPGNVP